MQPTAGSKRISSLVIERSSFLFFVLRFANAQVEPDQITNLDAFIVQDRSMYLVGEAMTSSQGVVGYSQLEDRPFL